MRPINEIITATCGKHSTRINDALLTSGVEDWLDLKSVDAFKAIKKYMTDSCSSGSVYIAKLAAAIAPYEEEVGGYAKNWRDLMRIDKQPSQQTYFSIDDLIKWGSLIPRNDTELAIILSGLIEARTGARISDTKNLDELNVDENGMLTYLSQKTKKWASIPSTKPLLSILKLRSSLKIDITDVWYNKMVKTLSERAGITYDIKLNQTGEQKVARKCEFLTSHDFRHGFCTNLHLSGEELLTISRMAGHTNTTMTERYIVATRRPGADKYNYFDKLDSIISKFYNNYMRSIA